MTAALLFVAALTTLAGERAQSELIERTLAIVAGQPITLADVRTMRALGLVSGADDESAVEPLIERTLMLREVERYAPSEPDASAVEQKLAGVRARIPKQALDRILAAGGFSEVRLRAWLRDDLRIESYLNQRFVPTGAPGQSRADLIDDWLADLRRRTPIVELWKKPII
jgi:hypothetical protein